MTGLLVLPSLILMLKVLVSLLLVVTVVNILSVVVTASGIREFALKVLGQRVVMEGKAKEAGMTER